MGDPKLNWRKPAVRGFPPAPASVITAAVNDDDWPFETTFYGEPDADMLAPYAPEVDWTPAPPPTGEAVSKALHDVFGFSGFRGV